MTSLEGWGSATELRPHVPIPRQSFMTELPPLTQGSQATFAPGSTSPRAAAMILSAPGRCIARSRGSNPARPVGLASRRPLFRPGRLPGGPGDVRTPVTVVTGAIESPACPFSGDRSYRLSYVTLSSAPGVEPGPGRVTTAGARLPRACGVRPPCACHHTKRGTRVAVPRSGDPWPGVPSG